MNGETRVTSYNENSIGTLSFYNPKGNSLTSDMLASLQNEMSELSAMDSVRSIILKSEGESAFCAGASFDELRSFKSEDEATEFFSRTARFLISIMSSPKPVICRVQGKAVGGALGIIAACDYVIASENADIRLSELTLGLGPFVIAPLLERKIGEANLSYMAIDTEWRSARWALDKGLYSRLCTNIVGVEHDVRAYAEKFTAFDMQAFADLKMSLNVNLSELKKTLLERAHISGKLTPKAHFDVQNSK